MRLRHSNPLLVLLAALMLFLPSLRAADLPLAKPETLGMSSARLARIDSVIEGYIADKRVAGTVSLVMRHGKVVYFKAHGMQDREKSIPMPKDAIFRICSMSKPITSVAVMMLYEEGRFMLGDPVSKYIPEFKNPVVLKKTPDGRTYTVPATSEITIFELLTHTSGLVYQWDPDLGQLYKDAEIGNGIKLETLTLAESTRRMAKLPLLFNPGERFEYGLNTDALGYLVEVVSGMPLDKFLKTRIFDPLGMNDTQFFVPQSKLNRLASVYTWYDGKGLQPFPDGPIWEGPFRYDADYPYKGEMKYFSGGGGLCASTQDYAKFAQMLLNGGQLNGVRLLSPKTVEMMRSMQVKTDSPTQDFGLGFGIQASLSEIGTKGKYGWGGFYNTQFFIDPKEELIGVIMSQLHPTGDLPLLDRFEVSVYQSIVD